MKLYRFGRHLALGLLLGAFAGTGATAQTPVKVKNLEIGGVLSGKLNVLRIKGKKGKRIATFQLTSEPGRLPPPDGLCGLETGPETFEIVTTSDAQASQLKPYVGKDVSIKVNEVACAHEAGQMSEAIVTKWSVEK